MPGVDYPALLRAIERRDLGIFDYLWAKDLAGVHAFLDGRRRRAGPTMERLREGPET
jgi:hypothetical protein